MQHSVGDPSPMPASPLCSQAWASVVSGTALASPPPLATAISGDDNNGTVAGVGTGFIESLNRSS